MARLFIRVARPDGGEPAFPPASESMVPPRSDGGVLVRLDGRDITDLIPAEGLLMEASDKGVFARVTLYTDDVDFGLVDRLEGT